MNDRIYNKSADNLRIQERVERLEIETVIELCLNEKEIKTLLDIGTGSGLFAEAFCKAGLKASGIDINKEMIEAAQLYLPESEFKIAKAEEIPFEDNTFDATFFGMVFHEIIDNRKALSEAFRVTRHFTFILEWQYKIEVQGPPIEHRVKPETIEHCSSEVGYKTVSRILLTNLVLYILEKE